MKLHEITQTQKVDIRITNRDLDKNGRLKQQYPDIDGDFQCEHTEITSLIGAPKRVGGLFYCFNTKITSLEGAPKYVGGSFSCKETAITSLEGSPDYIGGNFFCSLTQIQSLQHAPSPAGGFVCNNVNIPSLEGAPATVGESFSCRHTPITSLLGVPSEIKKDLYCTNTQIATLRNVHKIIKFIGGDFYPPETIQSNVLGLLLINQLKSVKSGQRWAQIIRQHLRGDRDVLDCQEELIKSGLKEYAKL